jgi:hypothetical protein
MDMKRNGSQPSAKGSPEDFTGNVRIDPLFQAPGAGQFGGASVTFEPGARSAWHTHPCGEILLMSRRTLQHQRIALPPEAGTREWQQSRRIDRGDRAFCILRRLASGKCYLHHIQSSVQHIQLGDTRLSQTLRGLVCGAALCLSACGSTTFVSTWKAPEAHGIDPVGKSIAALVISGDAAQRRSAEVYLANDLSIRGARGIAAYTLIGLDHPNVDYARARFKEAGIEGVVVMRLVGHDQRIVVEPGGFSSSTYRSFGSYYPSYAMVTTYSTGSVRTDTVVSIETLIYSLNNDKLLWAATSRTSNPAGLSGLVDEVADAVAKEVAKQGLIAR